LKKKKKMEFLVAFFKTSSSRFDVQAHGVPSLEDLMLEACDEDKVKEEVSP